MAKRGTIGDYTHTKLVNLIGENSGAGDVTNPVLDDVKLYFGTDSDSYVEYRETDDNFMVISGSTTGLVLSGSQLVLDTVTVASGTAAGPGSLLSVTSTGQVVLTASSPGGSDTQIQYNDAGSFDGISAFTWDDTDLKIADDTKLYFGTNSDAYIEYDEDGDDFMVISGSAVGVVLSGSTIVLTSSQGGIELAADGGAGQDINITNTGGSVHITSTEDVINAISLTSNSIYFNGGDQDDAYLFYSKPLYLDIVTEPGSTTGKLWSSAGYILNWGGLGFQVTGYELAYDVGSGQIEITGPDAGTYFSGSSVHVGMFGGARSEYIPTVSTPITALDEVTDFGVQSSQGDAIALVTDGQGGGEIIRLGIFDSGISTKGMVISLYQTEWYTADANDSTATGGANAPGNMLAVALDVDGGDDEGLVLLRGFIRVPSTLMNNYSTVADVGKPVFISTTAGEYDLAIPSTSADKVRIVGYLMDTDGTDFLIYFCPDNTWVELT